MLSASPNRTFGIVLSMADEEWDRRSERPKFGTMGRAKAGKISGVAKYGHTVDIDGAPLIHNVEGPIVRRIFEEYASG